MRKTLAAALVGAAALITVAPTAASAYCIALTADPVNVCVAPPCPAGLVDKVDEKLGDHLNPFGCLA